MFRHLARASLSVALLVIAMPASTQEEKLTKVEIGKRGKAATAFVAVPGRGSGTAFCVHPTGLFITNEHVVRGGENGEIILVLDPSLESQRVLKAKVVRIDKDLDLALLRVDGAKELPSLPLGSIEGIAELLEVIACGFPLGRALSPDKMEYPAISVNAGRVTALRYKAKGRELDHIQIDVALTYGNSGGPVLDTKGQVIGVVVSGIPAKGINQAIPVNQLNRFLMKPDVAFTPPELTSKTLENPMEFKANVVSFVPKTPEPTLKLILQAGDEQPREFQMQKKDGVWVVTTTPVAKNRAVHVEVSARIGTGTISGTAEDVVFKVGEKPVRLSGVRRIELKSKPGVLLSDGRTRVDGEVTRLGTVEIDVGGQKMKIDLSKATEVTVQAAPEIASVSASIVASVEGKEVARSESQMVIRDTGKSGTADPSTAKITPPVLESNTVVKRLPEAFSHFVLGGSGRYLIFHLPKLKKLAVFDINEAKVTKYIPLTEDDITFTAGLDSLVIGLRKSNKLERWSLSTFELEKTGEMPQKEEVRNVFLGHGSNGPLLANGFCLDLNTFRQLPIRNGNNHERIWGPAESSLIAGGDGTVFGFGSGGATNYIVGDQMRGAQEGGLGYAYPGPCGRWVYTDKGIFTPGLQRVDPDDGAYGVCIPAVRGDYFMSLGNALSVYLRGLKEPIAKLTKEDWGAAFDGPGATVTAWRSLFLVPDAKVIVFLPKSNDQIMLYKFDPEAALEKSGQDYLIVTSNAPREVKAGATFTYQIKVKSKQGGVTFKLDSGPKDMVVSAAGVVTWTVPVGTPTGDQDAILTIRDKTGQEVFHTFNVKVVK